MAACGKKEQSVPTKTENTTEQEKSSTKNEKEKSELSDDISDFQISINGTIYQLPMKYSAFTKAGWSYSGEEEEQIQPEETILSDWFQKKEDRILAKLMQFEEKKVAVSEAYISELIIDTNYIKSEDANVLLADEIQLNISTQDDVKAAYGEPTSTEQGEAFASLIYQLTDEGQVILVFDLGNGGVLSEITMENHAKPEEIKEKDKGEEVTEETEEEDYEAPLTMSTELSDYTVLFAGALYQLPIPVSEFVANGWIIVDNETSSLIEGGKTGKVTLMKNQQTLWTTVTNESEKTASVTECYVTKLASNVNDCNVDMEVFGGIRMGMSQEDLEKALTDIPYKKQVSSYTYYEISDEENEDGGYEIIVKDGKITGIEAIFE